MSTTTKDFAEALKQDKTTTKGVLKKVHNLWVDTEKKWEYSTVKNVCLACMNGDPELLEPYKQSTILQSKAVVELAIRSGHCSVVKRLYDFGVDVNYDEVEMWDAPLVIACGMCNSEMVDLLVRCGADINKKCSQKSTPLFIMASRGWVQATEILLKKGAETDLLCEYEDRKLSALHIACANGNFEVVKLLISYGADFRFSGVPVHSPLCVSCEGGKKSLRIFDFLVSLGAADAQAKLDRPEEWGERESILLWACQERNVEVIDRLITKCGVNVNTAPPFSFSPRVMACLYNHGWDRKYLVGKAQKREYDEILHFLKEVLPLVNREVLDETDEKGMSALHYMFKDGNYPVAKSLLLHGAKVLPTEDLSIRGPLHYIANYSSFASSSYRQQQWEIAQLAVKQSVDLNSPYLHCKYEVQTFETPLHTAIKSGFAQLVELVAQSGANYAHYILKYLRYEEI